MSPDRGRPTKQRPLRTAEVARAVGVHPNTVRLYEEWGFLPPIPRGPNGYRLFTTEHVDQMRLARTALQWPYPGGKDPVLALVLRAAAGDLGGALEEAYRYLAQVRAECAEAEAAAEFLDQWARGVPADATAEPLRIGQVALRFGADDLGSTMIEENVVAATGLTVRANREDLAHAIRQAGFTPAQRRSDYSLV